MRTLDGRGCVSSVRAILERVYWALGRRPRAVCGCGARSRLGAQSRFGDCSRLSACARLARHRGAPFPNEADNPI